MPSKPPHECYYPGCRTLTTSPRCSKHSKPKRELVEPWKPDPDNPRRNVASSAERGYDARWQKARRMFLNRNPWCVQCLERGIYRPAHVVDHIKPHRGVQSVMWDETNWQALCIYCHNAKSSGERFR